MTEDNMLLLKHKNELSINQLKVKHVNSEVSRDNMVKHRKIEVEQCRAEHKDKKARAASTLDYYDSNIVIFSIFLLKLLKFCKTSKICPIANLRLSSLLFLAKFVIVPFTIIVQLHQPRRINMWQRMSQDFRLRNLAKSHHSTPPYSRA